MDKVAQPTSGIRKYGLHFLMYGATLLAIVGFIYVIYKYIYSRSGSASNVLLSGKISASSIGTDNGVYDLKIPNIYEGGEFSTNFWIYITNYTTNMGQRKHILEIGHGSTNSTINNFSTMLIALGATTPTLLIRTHTQPNDSRVPGDNYGITDCSGGNVDCSGGNGKMKGFQQLTDKNLVKGNTMMDNTLYVQDIATFFTTYDACGNFIDENSTAFNTPNTCDVKELAMQKWINICTVMNGKTLDVYLDGKLVKTCVYNNYYKVDSTGTVASYLQYGGFDGYFSQLQIVNSSLTPDDIYKMYLAGPSGSSATSSPLSFLQYIFTG